MRIDRTAWAGLASWLLSGPAVAQVLSVAELNTEQIRALDRQKTVVILPGGILEIVTDAIAHDRALEARQEGWLRNRSPWPPAPPKPK
jgi:hypothetical protein